MAKFSKPNSTDAFRKTGVCVRVLSERLEKRLFEPRSTNASYELRRGPGLVVAMMAAPELANYVKKQLA
jgi:hypothetical protein